MREFDNQNAVGHCNPSQHYDAHERHYVHRRPRENQHDQYSRNSRRKRQQDDEGIDEGAELGYQNEIEQYDGQCQSDRKAPERSIHGLRAASYRNVHITRELLMVHHTTNVVGGSSQVLAGWTSINIQLAPNL